jgi:hypothetical protein
VPLDEALLSVCDLGLTPRRSTMKHGISYGNIWENMWNAYIQYEYILCLTGKSMEQG